MPTIHRLHIYVEYWCHHNIPNYIQYPAWLCYKQSMQCTKSNYLNLTPFHASAVWLLHLEVHFYTGEGCNDIHSSFLAPKLPLHCIFCITHFNILCLNYVYNCHWIWTAFTEETVSSVFIFPLRHWLYQPWRFTKTQTLWLENDWSVWSRN